VLSAFLSIKQPISFCFHMLQEQVVRWMKPPTTSLVFGTLADLTRGKAELLAENALLRQQLIILRRQIKRPVYKKTDRLLLVLLARMVRTWKQALFLVQPETLLRWHRELFRLFWKHKSKAHAKKPRLSLETMTLIKEMAANNRLWGAERIRGELLKLNIRVSKRTIQKYMKQFRPKQTHGQNWKTFLRNHAAEVSGVWGLRFPAGDGPPLPSALCLLHHRAEVAQGHPRECDTSSDRFLGRALVAGSDSIWTNTQIPDSG
jgi:putative transposase